MTVRIGPPPPRKPTFLERVDAEDRNALTIGLRAARRAAEAEAAVMSVNRVLSWDVAVVAAMLLRVLQPGGPSIITPSLGGLTTVPR